MEGGRGGEEGKEEEIEGREEGNQEDIKILKIGIRHNFGASNDEERNSSRRWHLTFSNSVLTMPLCSRGCIK